MRTTKKYAEMDRLPMGQAEGEIRPGCLVIEGGAFRGLYNQGVLDAFLLHNINIHTVIGVSAGALAGMNYVAGQIGRSVRANLGYRYDSRYIGLKALQSSGSILNIDFLLKTYETIEPLNRERFMSADRHFVAVVTNCLNGQTEYRDTGNCRDILAAIKASASMPYLSPMVDVDGTPCLDGGCSCKIAYRWALEHGFGKIVVIRTRDRSFRKPVRETHTAARFYKKYPAFAKKLDDSSREYNDGCDAVDALEKSGRVFVIAPSEPVTVGRLERNLEKLGDLYWLGYHDTLACLDSLRAYLET